MPDDDTNAVLARRVDARICAEYEPSDGSCQLKKSAGKGGPLAQLLERMSEDSLDTHSTLCFLRAL